MVWISSRSLPYLPLGLQKAGATAQLEECLLRMHRALDWILSTAESEQHDACCNPSPQKVKAGGLKTQGDPWLHKDFEVRLDDTPCLF